MDAEQAGKFFREKFGAEPDVIGSAPGRVNLIGEHTDYNGGQVLPMAIDRRTFVALRAKPGATSSRIVSDRQSTPADFDIGLISKGGQWWDYLTGVFAAFGSGGARLPQIEAAVTSDVPSGSGLGASAALELAASVAIGALVGDGRPLKDLAQLAWGVENKFVGVQCGVMDQFASALGETRRALHLWCDTLITEQVPMKEAVLIFDTATPVTLRASQYNQRRQECEEALRLLKARNPQLANLSAATPDEVRSAGLPENLQKRALHVTEENIRVSALADSLKASGEVSGPVLYSSHESLRTQYECSTEELDWFVDKSKKTFGVRGARLTGAGWGGCAIAVGDFDALTGAQRELASDYKSKFGREPKTWLTNAEQGAKVDMARK
ncbi:MAG TPA: galactokinase [Gemmatimonadaceae bacterium]|nr:galactokinase [Gemmatimonadaceae bacterium]